MPGPLSLRGRSAGLDRLLARRPPSVTAFVLVVAGLVGVVLVFVVPPFGGTDETGHFARAHQLSDGVVRPVESEDPADPPGGGACLPAEVVGEVEVRVSEVALGGEVDADPERGDAPDDASGCGPDERFVSFATFAWYPPVGYVPQVLGVGVGRVLGFGPVGMLRLARLGVLATYLVGLGLGLRWAGASRWALAAAGLLPIALFQAASVSPDAVTTGLTFAVLGSALRMARERGRPWLPRLVEASVLCLLLGLCKPTYGLVGLAYALPLLAAGHERGERRRDALLVVPAAVGLAVAAVWQRSAEHLFRCDTAFFGVEADADAQLRDLLTGPHRFVAGAGEAMVESAGTWVRGFVLVGDRVLTWPLVVAVVLLVLLVALGLRRDGDDRPLGSLQVALLAGIAVLGAAAVLGGWFVYCNSPGFDLDIIPSARLYVPFVAPALVAGGQVLARVRPLPPVGWAWYLGVAVVATTWTVAVAARF